MSTEQEVRDKLSLPATSRRSLSHRAIDERKNKFREAEFRKATAVRYLAVGALLQRFQIQNAIT